MPAILRCYITMNTDRLREMSARKVVFGTFQEFTDCVGAELLTGRQKDFRARPPLQWAVGPSL